MKKLFLLAALYCIFIPVFTQETANLEDELFASDEETVLTENEINAGTIKTDLNNAGISFETSKLKIGGSLDSKLTLIYEWDNPYQKQKDHTKAFLNPEKKILAPTIAGNIFFDARPVDGLKLYGKIICSFPFEKTQFKIPSIKIQELYTDFSAKNIAFFRFGKHTVRWGTGYFFSPADVINISRINPEKPDAEREGPVSLRTHIIIPKTQTNFWLYILPDTDTAKPEYTACAAKAEFVVGDFELGFGGYYRFEKAPRLIALLSGSIASKVSVFAEGIFAWGSDYTYHKNDAAFTQYTYKHKPFFQATLGTSYSHPKTHTGFSCQYFYNGFGYSDPEPIFFSAVERAAAMPDKSAENAVYNFYAMGYRGKHYISFLISQNKIGTEKLSMNLFQQFSISEKEGKSSINLNWNIYKFVSMNTGLNFSYPLSRHTNKTGSIGWTLGFNLGGGKF